MKFKTMIKNFETEGVYPERILLSAEVIIERDGKYYEVPIKMESDPIIHSPELQEYWAQFFNNCERITKHYDITKVNGKFPAVKEVIF